MSSTKSQHSETKQVESMQLDRSAPPSYSETNSIPDFDKDNSITADQAPLVPSAYDCQQKQLVDFPSASSSSQNKDHQPIVKQPGMNSEKCDQSKTFKSERDRKRDDDDDCCCTSFCNLCCMETCSCMVMCLEAAATSLQCVVACFICSDLCQ